jgi:ankyrin repeat protein
MSLKINQKIEETITTLYQLKSQIELSNSDKKNLTQLINAIYKLKTSNGSYFNNSPRIRPLQDFAWTQIKSHFVSYLSLKKFIQFYLQLQSEEPLRLLSRKMQEAIDNDNSSLVHALVSVLQDNDPPIPFEALTPPEGSTLPFFISAVLQNSRNCISKFIELDLPKDQCEPATGRSALHITADKKLYDMLKQLIAKHTFDPNARDKDNNTPLHILSKSDDVPLSIFFKLKEAAADLNAKNNLGYTPLMIACYYNHIRTAGALLQVGADPNTGHPIDLVTPLHISCYHGFFEVANLLLEKQVNVDAETNLKITPLHNASSYANASLINLLLNKNASPNKQDNDGKTALHYLLKMISKIGKNSEEDKELYQAIPDSLSLLLQANADPNIQDNENRTPFHEASALPQDIPDSQEKELLNMVTSCFTALFNHGAQSDLKAENGDYPFYELVESGNRYVKYVSEKHPSYYPYNLSPEEFSSHLLNHSSQQTSRWLQAATEKQKIAFLENNEINFTNKLLENWQNKKEEIRSETEFLKNSVQIKMGLAQAASTLQRLEHSLEINVYQRKSKELIALKIGIAKTKLELMKEEFAQMQARFTKEEPPILKCPISHGPIRDPVVEPSTKQIYERLFLEDWVRKQHISPLTSKPLTLEEIRTATAQEIEQQKALLNPKKRENPFKEEEEPVLKNRRVEED